MKVSSVVRLFKMDSIIYAPYIPDIDKGWDGKRRILLHPLSYHIYTDQGIRYVEVPVGFVSDLGSVPDLLKGLVDDNDESLAGFFLHDFLYHGNCPVMLPRAVTDQALKLMIRKDGQSWWRTFKTYRGVRLGRMYIPYHETEMMVDTRKAFTLLGRLCEVRDQILSEFQVTFD